MPLEQAATYLKALLQNAINTCAAGRLTTSELGKGSLLRDTPTYRMMNVWYALLALARTSRTAWAVY